jgi:hypothetical protein
MEMMRYGDMRYPIRLHCWVIVLVVLSAFIALGGSLKAVGSKDSHVLRSASLPSRHLLQS